MSGLQKSSICESSLDGLWYVTDDEGYTQYGVSLDRAKDVMWEMKNEDPYFKNKKLRLVQYKKIH